MSCQGPAGRDRFFGSFRICRSRWHFDIERAMVTVLTLLYYENHRVNIYQGRRVGMRGKSRNGIFLLCCGNWDIFWEERNKIEENVFGGMFGENGLIGLGEWSWG